MKKNLHLFIKTLGQKPHARIEDEVMTQAKDISSRYKKMMTRLAQNEVVPVDKAEWDRKMERSTMKLKKTLKQLAKF